MPINYRKLGMRISIERKKKRITQEALAEKINCSASYISYIENGTKRLSMDYFVDIANTLGCSADVLLIDQLDNTITVKSRIFEDLMQDCEDYEQKVIYDIISATKISLKKYVRSLKQRR